MPFPRLHTHAHQSILIVEDDINIREALKLLIELEGYIVFTASNGKDALDKLRMLKPECHPCLIITDLMMPIMGGDEFLEVVRASDTLITIPIALMTASPKVPLDLKSRKVPVIRKPFALDAILDIVRASCAPPSHMKAFVETPSANSVQNAIDELQKDQRESKKS